MAWQSKARWEIQTEIEKKRVGGVREMPDIGEDRCWNLSSKTQPCVYTQIKRNGLI